MNKSDADYFQNQDAPLTLAAGTSTFNDEIGDVYNVDGANAQPLSITLPGDNSGEAQTVTLLPLDPSTNHFVQLSGVSNSFGFINQNGDQIIEQMVCTPASTSTVYSTNNVRSNHY